MKLLPSASIILFLPYWLTACGSYQPFAESSAHSLSMATTNIRRMYLSSPDHRIQLISGDFNGDGWMDNVYISAQNKDDWVIIFQSDALSNKTPELTFLKQFSPPIDYTEVILETLPAGKYQTLCASVDEYCEGGTPKEIHLTHDAFLLTVLEASASIIYWDAKTKSFRRAWLSD